VQPAGGLDTAAVNVLSVAAVPTACFTTKSKLAIVAEDAKDALAHA
jgi:hypothetical protein